MPPGSGSRFALYNWRLPTRLIAILIVPVVAGLIFAGLRVSSSVEFAQEADQAERVAKLARTATRLADALQNERDITALPLTRGDRDAAVVTKARQTTDQILTQFKADAAKAQDNERVVTRVKAAKANLSWLQNLRKDAFKPDLMPLATQQAYSELFRPLMAFDNELGFGSTKVTSRGRAVYAISLAKASSSTQRALVQAALARDSLSPFDSVAVQSAVTLEQTAYSEFLSGALPEDVGTFQAAMGANDGHDHNTYLGWVLGVKPGSSLAAAGLRPSTWYKVASQEINLLRKVELAITQDIVEDAQDLRAEAERDALVNGVAAILAVVIAAFLTFFISRSMVRGMGILRASAMDIAEHRMPSLVEALSKADPDRVDTKIEPIPLFGRDEIGEVARAFDQVHSETVRLAAEQALLRGNVNAIFTNLSRRNQGLIQRQLTLITDLENNEADPDQLSNLFKLDHLATRMRRNGENLLVLAGEEPGRRWTQPVPLVDVLRAAASEVEQYERVELFGIPDTEIHGTAVNDLVHLLAELLENATSFSSPHTKVRVNGTRLPDGRVVIEIHDKGIGLTPEDFADINHKLAHPPTVDVSVARRMGLFVVGRLSQRHDIRVQLRPSSESAGTTSLVMLPEPITHGGGEPEDETFTVSRIVPQSELPTYHGGTRTAVELGFDESRYENADAATGDNPTLDPVGRSLKRVRRRAELEAAQEDEATRDPLAERLGEQDPAFSYSDDHQVGEQRRQDGQAGTEWRYRSPEPFNGEHPHADGDAYGGEGSQRETGKHTESGAPHTSVPGQGNYGEYPTSTAAYPEAGQYTTDGYEATEADEGPRGSAGYGETSVPQDGAGYGDSVGYPNNGQYTADSHYQDAGYSPGDGYTARDYQRDAHVAPMGHLPEEPPYDKAASQRYDAQTQSFIPGSDKDRFDEFPPPGAQQGISGSNGFDSEEFGHGAASEGVSFTDNGLPRRMPNWQRSAAGSPPENARATQNTEDAEGVDTSEWQATNDGNWQRASKTRQPRAGGVTSSGLPRRVPKANLVPGHAQQTPQDGPQLSRAPDAVRGRLTNLRMGIQRGRQAGNETNGQGQGPDEQER